MHKVCAEDLSKLQYLRKRIQMIHDQRSVIILLPAYCLGFPEHPLINVFCSITTIKHVGLSHAKAPLGIISVSTIVNHGEAELLHQQAGQSTLAATGLATDHYDLPSFHALHLPDSHYFIRNLRRGVSVRVENFVSKT